ncbi:SEFIR domain-containing protein [Actinokineospora bangkokensis]|uniref:SEFIR domain-containing protein n=1 Tax=Actinokineospora bangkokensis TaxID=1193682 RepID=A0A1Q9LQM5_9PSEU|nr:SEFIR domain-containing protein [Actinokineospora bangkokensis]OLR94346.1 hypothetical protein BJP25_11305 [Actinokineospora bangkokensis]
MAEPVLDAAPRVFMSYSHDSEHHRDAVGRFADCLEEELGLEVLLDQYEDAIRIDWGLFAHQMRSADRIIAVASRDYRRRIDGEAAAGEGRGAQFEGGILRDIMTEDAVAGTRKILPVVLPGWTVDDIPRILNPHSMTHFLVQDVSAAGLGDIVRAITGVARHQRKKRGQWLGKVGPDGVLRDAAAGPARVCEQERWLRSSPQVRAGGARLGGVEHADSVVLSPGVPAQGFVEVELPAGRHRFTAVAGVLDDAVERFQTGRFRVLVDGKPRWEATAGIGQPQRVDVVVQGQVLRLEMERPPALPGSFAGRPPELAWGDPVVR